MSLDMTRVHSLVARTLAVAAGNLEDQARYEARSCDDAGFEVGYSSEIAEAAVGVIRAMAKAHHEHMVEGRPLAPSLGLDPS